MLLSFLGNYHWTLHSSHLGLLFPQPLQFMHILESLHLVSSSPIPCSKMITDFSLFRDHHKDHKDFPLSLPFLIITSSYLVSSQQNLSWRGRTIGTDLLRVEFSQGDVSRTSPPTQREATTFHSSQVMSTVSSCLKFLLFILLLVVTSQLNFSHEHFNKKAHYLVVKNKDSEIKRNLDLTPPVSLTTYGSLGKCFKLSQLQSSYLKEDIISTFNSKIFMEIQVDKTYEEFSQYVVYSKCWVN